MKNETDRLKKERKKRTKRKKEKDNRYFSISHQSCEVAKILLKKQNYISDKKLQTKEASCLGDTGAHVTKQVNTKHHSSNCCHCTRVNTKHHSRYCCSCTQVNTKYHSSNCCSCTQVNTKHHPSNCCHCTQ